MNVDPENFGALQKLLAFKRLEQPDPGYFDRLAGQIVYRLETGEGELSVWERFSAAFAVRPALAYGIALAVCGAVAVATVYSFKMGVLDTSSQIASVESWDFASPALAGQINTGRSMHVLSWPSTTNAVADDGPAHSLFQPVNLIARPAAYRAGY